LKWLESYVILLLEIKMKEEEIKKILLQDSEEFRRIYEEHQRCEKALNEIQSKSFLNEDDYLQEKQLKKKKLKLKDEMYRIISRFERRTENDG
jgi:hypothetical protein